MVTPIHTHRGEGESVSRRRNWSKEYFQSAPVYFYCALYSECSNIFKNVFAIAAWDLVLKEPMFSAVVYSSALYTTVTHSFVGLHHLQGTQPQR